MQKPVNYYPEADVLYVTLADHPVARTEPLDDLRLIDYSQDGAVVGIEFIGASGGVDPVAVPFAHRVEELIGDSGLPLNIFA